MAPRFAPGEVNRGRPRDVFVGDPTHRVAPLWQLRIGLTSTQGKVLKSYGHASGRGRYRESEGMMSCKKRGCVLH